MSETIKIKINDDQHISAAFAHGDATLTPVTDDTLIIVLHSFPGSNNGTENIYKLLIPSLIDKGYQCLAPNFRGCGDSSGYSAEFTLQSAKEDIQACIDWAKTKDITRIIFIAEGLSAHLPLLFKDEEICILCNVVLWPCLDLQHVVNVLLNGITITESDTKKGYIIVSGTQIGVPLINELKTSVLAQQLPPLDAPLLIMHGEKDKISPYDSLDILRNLVTNRRLEITSFQDGEHGLPQKSQRESMLYQIHQFIAKYT